MPSVTGCVMRTGGTVHRLPLCTAPRSSFIGRRTTASRSGRATDVFDERVTAAARGMCGRAHRGNRLPEGNERQGVVRIHWNHQLVGAGVVTHRRSAGDALRRHQQHGHERLETIPPDIGSAHSIPCGVVKRFQPAIVRAADRVRQCPGLRRITATRGDNRQVQLGHDRLVITDAQSKSRRTPYRSFTCRLVRRSGHRPPPSCGPPSMRKRLGKTLRDARG